jgi:signal transduction histidine kinase
MPSAAFTDLLREEDIRELQRLLEAATLALINSAAYTEQREAEALIRQLYQHLQQAQDTAAAALARELHDEVMNVGVRLNIEALQKVIPQISEPNLRSKLERVLATERTMIQTLRMICEQLHPTGLDDPLGLASVLHMQIVDTQAIWSGNCRLIVAGEPCPVPAQMQREALRTRREALMNAVKHAQATEIVVALRYPDAPAGRVQVVVRDNGCGGGGIRARRGHFGVRNMLESARAVGGALEFRRVGEGGSAVVFRMTGDGGGAAEV